MKTIGELIDALSKFPRETPVYLQDNGRDDEGHIFHVYKVYPARIAEGSHHFREEPYFNEYAPGTKYYTDSPVCDYTEGARGVVLSSWWGPERTAESWITFDKEVVASLDYKRACGETECSKCGKTYYDHPKHDNCPWLVVSCNEGLLKL